MPNEDRISEGYRGEIWAPPTQEAARQRIHWMCAQAEGRVLDLGCSQGIASILLGREGLTVTGVDHEISRLVFGRRDLKREDPCVRQRVSFLAAEGAKLPFADGTFDTVLLGEVLEHLTLPHLLLEEVRRVLAPVGRLVVTTPLGYHPFHDHKATFYPHSLASLVERWFVVEGMELTDRYLLLAGRCPKPGSEPGGAAEATLATQGSLESFILAVEKREAALTKAQAQNRTEIRALNGELAELREEREAMELKVDEVTRTLTRQGARSESELGQKISNLRQLLAQSEHELGQEIDKLRHRLALTRWWLQVETSRRWSRIGRELLDAWPHPVKILRLPYRLFKVVTTKIPPPPRPRSLGGS